MERVFEASADVVIAGMNEDLRLVPEPSESTGMQDPSVVPLEFGAYVVAPLGVLAPRKPLSVCAASSEIG